MRCREGPAELEPAAGAACDAMQERRILRAPTVRGGLDAQLRRVPQGVIDQCRVRFTIRVLAPMRQARVDATANHPFDARGDPWPSVGARRRLAVQPVRDDLKRRAVYPALECLTYEGCPLVRHQSLAVVLDVAVGNGRSDVHAPADR